MAVREINLNIVKEYVSDSDWGEWALVREIYANASDMDPMWQVHWNQELMTLEVSNAGFMDMGALGMGATEKRGSLSIGQFGEGMKLAALVGLRIMKPITIRTANYFINFSFKKPFQHENRSDHPGMNDERWEKFINADYLFATVATDMTFREKTVVTIGNWNSPNLYADRFIGGGLDDGIKILFEYEPSGDLIVEGGNLYNKGVYVSKLDDYHFGYNLNNIKMNRDRSAADSWQIGSEIRDMWSRHVTDARLWVEFFRAVEAGKREKDLYFSNSSSAVFPAIREAWVLKYKQRPAAMQSDLDSRLEATIFLGEKDRPVILPDSIYELVERAGILTLKSIIETEWLTMSTRKKNEVMELEDEHKKLLTSLRRYARKVFELSYRGKVDVEFSLATESDYITNEDEHIIRIPAKFKDDRTGALAELIWMLAYIKGGDFCTERGVALVAAMLL